MCSFADLVKVTLPSVDSNFDRTAKTTYWPTRKSSFVILYTFNSSFVFQYKIYKKYSAVNIRVWIFFCCWSLFLCGGTMKYHNLYGKSTKMSCFLEY